MLLPLWLKLLASIISRPIAVPLPALIALWSAAEAMNWLWPNALSGLIEKGYLAYGSALVTRGFRFVLVIDFILRPGVCRLEPWAGLTRDGLPVSP